jgi:prolyl-tRNA editing enzyme YbaK/EbsC (Cys-tRNA(Pro) deacylase)
VQLEPQCCRTSRDRLPGDVGRLLGRAEDVDEAGLRYVCQPLVSTLTDDRPAARVHRDDAPAVLLHVHGDVVGGLVLGIACADHGDRVVRPQDLLDHFVGVHNTHTTVDVVTGPGTLDWRPAIDHLVADPVADALAQWGRADVLAAPIDPELADTAAFCAAYDVNMDDSANCVVIAGRRGDVTRYAACVVLATTRADVNGLVRKRLDARKASFAPMDEAVALTGMEFGGITPIGLPAPWPIFIDAAVLGRDVVVIGSGLRRSKLALPSAALADLHGAEVIDGLAA